MHDFLKQYQQFSAKMGKAPKVKVGKQWLEKQLQSTFVLRDGSDNQLYGIPVEVDEETETFAFVYEE